MCYLINTSVYVRISYSYSILPSLKFNRNIKINGQFFNLPLHKLLSQFFEPSVRVAVQFHKCQNIK